MKCDLFDFVKIIKEKKKIRFYGKIKKAKRKEANAIKILMLTSKLLFVINSRQIMLFNKYHIMFHLCDERRKAAN